MRLNINDTDHLDSPTESDIRKCIETLGVDQFVVLWQEEGFFVQSYHNADGTFELEYRHGSADQHYKVASNKITVADVVSAFCLFLAGSEELVSCCDWELLDLDAEVGAVNEDLESGAGELVEYHGVLMPADWPQEIEEAQELKTYLMHGQSFERVANTATAGGQDDQCQDCGVLVDQFHVPGCPQEQCPRCPDLLVECSCEIDVD